MTFKDRVLATAGMIVALSSIALCLWGEMYPPYRDGADQVALAGTLIGTVASMIGFLRNSTAWSGNRMVVVGGALILFPQLVPMIALGVGVWNIHGWSLLTIPWLGGLGLTGAAIFLRGFIRVMSHPSGKEGR